MPRDIEDTLIEAPAPFGAQKTLHGGRPAGDRPPTLPEAPLEPEAPLFGGAAEPQASFERFRPLSRPPIAMLRVLDDGQGTFETVRLRGDQFAVGRVEGDLVIPHDSGISGRHLRIERTVEDGDYCWHVIDSGSTNGTFFSVATYQLRHGQELLIGGRRYRYETPGPAAAGAASPAADRQVTSQWQALSPGALRAALPELVELAPGGEETRRALTADDVRVGADAAKCGLTIAGDPYLEPVHCRIYKDPNGRWRIENLATVNGTWLRLERVRVDRSVVFQAGEQRLVLHVRV